MAQLFSADPSAESDKEFSLCYNTVKYGKSRPGIRQRSFLAESRRKVEADKSGCFSARLFMRASRFIPVIGSERGPYGAN